MFTGGSFTLKTPLCDCYSRTNMSATELYRWSIVTRSFKEGYRYSLCFTCSRCQTELLVSPENFRMGVEVLEKRRPLEVPVPKKGTVLKLVPSEGKSESEE